MEEYEIIGKIDINKLGKYKKLIETDEVILTNERKEHVNERHIESYKILKYYLSDVIYSPDYILEDLNHKDTIILLKEILSNGQKIKMVVRLNTNKEEKRYNSIITFWSIRDRDYNKTIRKSKIIYKKLDKEE